VVWSLFAFATGSVTSTSTATTSNARGSAAVTFSVIAITYCPGEEVSFCAQRSELTYPVPNIYVTGYISQLGNWTLASGVSEISSHTWLHADFHQQKALSSSTYLGWFSEYPGWHHVCVQDTITIPGDEIYLLLSMYFGGRLRITNIAMNLHV
jgi:hypothetical protein